MSYLAPLLRHDPARPRITVYDESAGTRMEFSALTVDNWVAKIANMLREEYELGPDTEAIIVDLEISWPAIVIIMGAQAAGVEVQWGPLSPSSPPSALLFSTVARYEQHYRGTELLSAGSDILLVSSDPFGRGISESGGELPEGTEDFFPTVRFFGDHFPNPQRTIGREDSGPRRLSTGWSDISSFEQEIIEPLDQGGSVVVIAGLVSADRREKIAADEKIYPL